MKILKKIGWLILFCLAYVWCLIEDNIIYHLYTKHKIDKMFKGKVNENKK